MQPQMKVSTFLLFFSCIHIAECENSQMSPQRKSCISYGTLQPSSLTQDPLF